jgi:hypothetical protein
VIDGSKFVGKSLIAISTSMKLLPLQTPIRRISMALVSFLRLRAKSCMQLLQDLTVGGTSRGSSARPGCRFLLLKDFSRSKAPSYSNLLLGPSPRYHEGTIPPELVNSDSFREICTHFSCSTFNNFQVLSLSNSVHL